MRVETIALIGGAISLLTVCLNLIVTLMAMLKIEAVHKATNSMHDALIETTRQAALALGRTMGIAEEKSRMSQKDDQM